MYHYLTDIQHELLTKYREHDRANDFARRDEYLALLDSVNELQETISNYLDAIERIETLAGHALITKDGDTITDDTPQVKALAWIHELTIAIQLGTYDPSKEGPIA